jgi:hypothetical protein
MTFEEINNASTRNGNLTTCPMIRGASHHYELELQSISKTPVRVE